MPTYKNDTPNRITFPDKTYLHWEPGEAKSLPYFVPWQTLGLTLTSPEPYVNRQDGGYWELVLKPGERQVIDLMPYLHTFQLSVFAPKGLVKMWVGDDPTPIIVDPQNTHLSKRAWDMTAYLTFEAFRLGGGCCEEETNPTATGDDTAARTASLAASSAIIDDGDDTNEDDGGNGNNNNNEDSNNDDTNNDDTNDNNNDESDDGNDEDSNNNNEGEDKEDDEGCCCCRAQDSYLIVKMEAYV